MWPVAVALRGLVHSSNTVAPDALRRLRRLLQFDKANTLEEARVAALAELLGFAGEHESARLGSATPSRLKELTLDALVAGAAQTALVRPLVILIEDAHWLDPTTLELVERVIAEASTRRILVLLTARDEFLVPANPAWATITTLELRGLQESEATQLFAASCGGAAPARIGRDVAARTGGVPLFVEEFASAVVKYGECEEVSIPATLYECLAARLDRAGPAKGVAQAAAVLGQNCMSAAPVALVAGLPESIVAESLSRLEAVGVMERRHDVQGRSWSFRHALLRESAYDSLLRDRRRILHSRAADALVNEAEPALLARHLSEAGRAAESVPHFLSAARRSLARSSLQEAIRLLRRGLAALESLPRDVVSQERRLELMALLGPALIGLNGPGSPEVHTLYTEAVALAGSLPPREEHFPIFWGWWRLSHVRDFDESRARAAWLYTEAREKGDRGLLLQAHHCNWAALHHQGDLWGSAQHVREGLAIYREDEHGGHASLYGNHDAKVCAHAHHALGLWQRGLAQAAEVEEAHSLAWAQHLGHVGSVLHALEVAMVHRSYRHNPEEVRAAADRLWALAEEQGYNHYRTRCGIFHGWAMAMLGDAAKGASVAAESLANEREVNTADDFAVFQCLVAEAWAAAGQQDRALTELTAACTDFESIGLYHWLPEVWRMIGDLTLQVDAQAAAKAAQAYAKAEHLAGQQGAHRLALRAAIGGARLALLMGERPVAARLITMMERVVDVEPGATDLHEAEALMVLLRGNRAVSDVSSSIVAGRMMQ
jgi:predicted ATPase